MKLVDPGKGKAKEEAKVEREKAWKRPTKKADRDKLRKDRTDYAKEVYGDGHGIPDQGKGQRTT